VAAGLSAVLCASPARAERWHSQTVKLALIDPLSGPLGDVGRNAMRSWAFLTERLQVNPEVNPSGMRFHFAAFDNTGSPQTSFNMLKAAIDQGFRYFTQGLGSGVAAALVEAIGRHNQRNPNDPVLLLNYAAMDPALTNERCSFWHYRVDADTSMKMMALAKYMGKQGGFKRLYLVNQDYAHGQQVSAYFKRYVVEHARGARMVGDDLHSAFGKTDFSFYAKRIAASGAQAVVTGNWGSDLTGLVQALHAQGVHLPLFTYYASLKGTPTVLASVGDAMPVYQVASHHDRQGGPLGQLFGEFRQRHGEDLVMAPAYDALQMLMRAMHSVQSTDVMPVAARMSGMLFEGYDGPVQMRPDDHQLQKGVYITRWVRHVPGQGRNAEGTGWQFVPVDYFAPSTVREPTRCVMNRPDY
jgi:branched-chain amino acid transport system substrate-binding protein